ncbi:hypothetical protein MBLNU459_g4989t1 [Dothideomycetes sp. NU459]
MSVVVDRLRKRDEKLEKLEKLSTYEELRSTDEKLEELSADEELEKLSTDRSDEMEALRIGFTLAKFIVEDLAETGGGLFITNSFHANIDACGIGNSLTRRF